MNDKDLQDLIKRAVNIHKENSLHLVKKAEKSIQGIPFRLICDRAVEKSLPGTSAAVEYLGLDDLEDSVFRSRFRLLYESEESQSILRNFSYIRNYNYYGRPFEELGTSIFEFTSDGFEDFVDTTEPFTQWLSQLAGAIDDKVKAGTPSDLTEELGIEIEKSSLEGSDISSDETEIEDSPDVDGLDDVTTDSETFGSGDTSASGSKTKATQGTRTILYYMFYDFANKAFAADPLKKLAVFGNSPNFDNFWYNLPRTYGRDKEIMSILNTQMECTELVPIEPKPEETKEKTETTPAETPPPSTAETPPPPPPPPPSSDTPGETTTASTLRNNRKSIFRIITSAEDPFDPTSYKDIEEVFGDKSTTKESGPAPTHTLKEVNIKFYDLGFKEYNCDPILTKKLFGKILSRIVELTNRNQFQGVVNLLGAPFQALGNLKGLIAPTKDRFGR